MLLAIRRSTARRRRAGSPARRPAHRARSAARARRSLALGVAAAGLLAITSSAVGLRHRATSNDWVAFVTFIVTAIVVGELAARAERRQLEAQAGARDRAALSGAAGGVRSGERSRSGAAQRTVQGGAARCADAQPADAADGDQGGGHGADRRRRCGRRSRRCRSEGRRELLEVIDEESDRLNRFIEGLSAADRPDAVAAAQPARRAVSRRSSARALTRAGNADARHRVQVALDDALPPLSVDAAADGRSALHPARQRQQVLAARAPTIRVAARRRAMRITSRLSVADEGPGIPPSCASACSKSSSGSPDASRTIRGATASASACRSPGGWSRRRADASGSSRRPSGDGTLVVMTLPVSRATRISSTRSNRHRQRRLGLTEH